MNKLAKLSRTVLKQQIKVMSNLGGMAVDVQYLLTAKPGNAVSPVNRIFNMDLEKEAQQFSPNTRAICSYSSDGEKMLDAKELVNVELSQDWGELGELGDNYVVGRLQAPEEIGMWRDPLASRVCICNLPGVQNVNYV